jgi:hypothetical protein
MLQLIYDQRPKQKRLPRKTGTACNWTPLLTLNYANVFLTHVLQKGKTFL